jgi:hypothetical protein
MNLKDYDSIDRGLIMAALTKMADEDMKLSGRERSQIRKLVKDIKDTTLNQLLKEQNNPLPAMLDKLDHHPLNETFSRY